MMNRPDALFASLERCPDDWLARAALADWFEETGLDSSAACLRWMYQKRIRPSLRLSGGAMWFTEGKNGSRMIYTDHDAYLPAKLFEYLRQGSFVLYAQCLMRLYEQPREAEEDLLAAWAEAVQSGLWKLAE